jgi:hypothetical protein
MAVIQNHGGNSHQRAVAKATAKKNGKAIPAPILEDTTKTEAKSGIPRPFVLSAGLGIVGCASQLALAKGWANWIPDWAVIALYVLALVPIGYWGISHEKLFRQRSWAVSQFKKRPYAATASGVILLVIVVLSLFRVGSPVLAKVEQHKPPAVNTTATTGNAAASGIKTDKPVPAITVLPGSTVIVEGPQTNTGGFYMHDFGNPTDGPPVGIDNAGLLVGGRVVGGTVLNRPTGQAVQPAADLRPWLQYLKNNPSSKEALKKEAAVKTDGGTANPGKKPTKPALTKEQETSIFNKILKAYEDAHGSEPSVAWVNRQLQAQGYNFRVNFTVNMPPPDTQLTLTDATVTGTGPGMPGVLVVGDRTDIEFAGGSISGNGGPGFENKGINSQVKFSGTEINDNKGPGFINDPKPDKPQQ